MILICVLTTGRTLHWLLQNEYLALPSRQNNALLNLVLPSHSPGKSSQFSTLGFPPLLCCCSAKGWLLQVFNQQCLSQCALPKYFSCRRHSFQSHVTLKNSLLGTYLGNISPESVKMKTPWKMGMLSRFIQCLEALQRANCFLLKVTDI